MPRALARLVSLPLFMLALAIWPTSEARAATVTLAAPPSPVHGTVTLTAETTVSRFARLEIRVDGQTTHTCRTSPCTWQWDTSQYTNGAHTLRSRVVRRFGSDSSARIVVSVDNAAATPSPPAPTPPLASPPPPVSLDVTLNGSGTVTSNPPGINCGSDCNESYPTGTSVTLTPAPASGFRFDSWGGAGISCPGTGSCTVTMSTARSVTARFVLVPPPTPAPLPPTLPPTTASSDLCIGLVTDKLAHPMTALAKPAPGTAFVDPQFGTTIRRITAATGSRVPAYSTIPAWNADESLLILYHTGTGESAGHWLYDGKTYQLLRKLSISPADLEQFYWHPTDPDLLFYINAGTKQLIRFHVSSNLKEVVRTFTGSGGIGGGSDPQYISWDGDLIGLKIGSQHLLYRISTNTESPRVTDTETNAPIALASGRGAYWANGGISEVRDGNMALLFTRPQNGNEHASVGRLADGTDTHNSVQFDGSPVGSLIVADLTNQANPARVVIGQAVGYPYPKSGTHVSAVAHKNAGWVAVSSVGNPNGLGILDQEILLANTNPGGAVCRVGHHRSTAQDYFAEPHVVISPSGTRLLFGSDWGVPGGMTDSYVIELPSFRP